MCVVDVCLLTLARCVNGLVLTSHLSSVIVYFMCECSQASIVADMPYFTAAFLLFCIN